MLFPRAGRRGEIAGTCCPKATDRALMLGRRTIPPRRSPLPPVAGLFLDPIVRFAGGLLHSAAVDRFYCKLDRMVGRAAGG